MVFKIHAVIAASLVAAMSQAILLPPGGRVGRNNATAPGVLTVFTDTGTLIAQNTGTFSTSSINGTVTSAVFRNTDGMLDFGFQLTAGANSDPIHRITLYNYGNFTTDIGYLTSLFTPWTTVGTVLASEANRSANGSVVGFDYDPSTTTGLNAGTTTFAMIVRTNATQFTTGNVGVIDGVTANVSGFAPVPEPASLAVLGIGALSLLRRRRRS